MMIEIYHDETISNETAKNIWCPPKMLVSCGFPEIMAGRKYCKLISRYDLIANILRARTNHDY